MGGGYHLASGDTYACRHFLLIKQNSFPETLCIRQQDVTTKEKERSNKSLINMLTTILCTGGTLKKGKGNKIDTSGGLVGTDPTYGAEGCTWDQKRLYTNVFVVRIFHNFYVSKYVYLCISICL